MDVVILEYLDILNASPYRRWVDRLPAAAAAIIATAVYRLSSGNWSSVKGVGGGVYEYRIDRGPGYRIYFGKDGDQLVILLGGGTKQRQSADIEVARARWADYKQRKRG